MGAQKQTSARRARTKERQAVALRLRASGATYANIGEHLGISAPSAYALVRNALHDIPAEAVADHRALELQRLDRLMLAVWQNATAGGQGAIDRVLKIMDRRARLLGLDAPALTADVSDWTDEELNEYATTGRLPAGRRRGIGTPPAGIGETPDGRPDDAAPVADAGTITEPG